MNQKGNAGSNMMTTGFLVSPLDSNTREFASRVAKNPHSQDESKVESISIAPSYGGSVLWSGTYALTLKRYHGELGQYSSYVIQIHKDHSSSFIS
jgi:hypothetical protein